MTISRADPDPAIRPEVTARLQRGVGRALVAADQAVLFEFALANGRRADVVALDHQGRFTIIEIKSGLADFQADHKWRDYQDYCDFFAFAVAADFPAGVLPPDEGLMIADGFGAEFVRPARLDPLSAARRKAMLIRFARAGAGRLQALLDPTV
ncbi:MAG: MmcB family DNA repair protein [Alphaproteobacteria bacterium]|nr:MmcB family DNA repair protein [Alphaproteobacteria bacterium]